MVKKEFQWKKKIILVFIPYFSPENTNILQDLGLHLLNDDHWRSDSHGLAVFARLHSMEDFTGASILQKVLTLLSQSPKQSVLLFHIPGQAWETKPPGAAWRAKMRKKTWHRLTRSLQCYWVAVIASSISWGNPLATWSAPSPLKIKGT